MLAMRPLQPSSSSCVTSSSSLKILMLLFAPPFRGSSYAAIAARRASADIFSIAAHAFLSCAQAAREQRALQHTGWGGPTRTKSARARATAGVAQGSTRMGVAAAGPHTEGQHTRAYRLVHGGHPELLVCDEPRGRRRNALLDMREQVQERLAHVHFAIPAALHPARRRSVGWLQRSHRHVMRRSRILMMRRS